MADIKREKSFSMYRTTKRVEDIISGVDHGHSDGLKLPSLHGEQRRHTDIQRFNLVTQSNSPEYMSPRAREKSFVRTSSVADSDTRKSTTLKASEIPYEKRIKTLESENERLSKNYQKLYRENQLLRGRLETGSANPGHAESYKRLASDRELLIEAETTYRRRIAKLQDEAKETAKRLDDVVIENDALRSKTITFDELKIERMQDKKLISELEAKLTDMRYKLKKKSQELANEVKAKDVLERDNVNLKGQISEVKKKSESIKKELAVLQSSHIHSHR